MGKSKNPFEKAFEKAQKAKPEKARQLGIKVSVNEPVHGRSLEVKDINSSTQGLTEPPMMYRAQVQGLCNLQFAGDRGNNPDRTQWMKQWLQSENSSEPKYRYHYEAGGDKTKTPIYSFTVEFPYRVFSNSGQDSILRPVLGKNGIPYIPGSSIKGLLKRLCYSTTLSVDKKDLIHTYCGNEEKPGTLRFHGAFPIGNWANQIVDVVHPQQHRQVEDNTPGSAFALLSFYQPTFAFEFSSADSIINWPQVESLVRQALRLGLGGKTSTGYGFAEKPDYADPTHPDYATACHFWLNGKGVSSLLLNHDPEFRPNLFKASLRGHLSRLLGGVCNDQSTVEKEVGRLLGSTDYEGAVKLFWQFDQKDLHFIDRRISTYEIQGSLHLQASKSAALLAFWWKWHCKIQNDRPLRAEVLDLSSISLAYHLISWRAKSADLDFVVQVLKFAYTMGGFGKTWRRVWHHDFYTSYYMRDPNKFPIGCHWESCELSWINPKKSLPEQLTTFLQNIHEDCFKHLDPASTASVATATPITTWRESFHPNRVAVYCSQKPVTQSSVIHLFHNDDFKTTRAIGGRDPHRHHPREVKAPSYTSHVWHRMLPIGQDSTGKEQYLEIVTVFYGDRDPWQRHGVDQFHPFINQLTANGLTLAWGTNPPRLPAPRPHRVHR